MAGGRVGGENIGNLTTLRLMIFNKFGLRQPSNAQNLHVDFSLWASHLLLIRWFNFVKWQNHCSLWRTKMVCFVLKTVAKMRLGMMRQNLVVNALLNMLFFFSSLLLLLKDANLLTVAANDVCQKHAFILFSTTVEGYVECTIEHTLQPLDSATYPNE